MTYYTQLVWRFFKASNFNRKSSKDKRLATVVFLQPIGDRVYKYLSPVRKGHHDINLLRQHQQKLQLKIPSMRMPNNFDLRNLVKTTAWFQTSSKHLAFKAASNWAFSSSLAFCKSSWACQPKRSDFPTSCTIVGVPRMNIWSPKSGNRDTGNSMIPKKGPSR